MNSILKEVKRGNPGTARAFIPCNELNIQLRIKEDASQAFVFPYHIEKLNHIVFPKMLSPYLTVEVSKSKRILKQHVPDKMIDWVYENRYDSRTTKQNIIDAYNKFCTEVDIDVINKS